MQLDYAYCAVTQALQSLVNQVESIPMVTGSLGLLIGIGALSFFLAFIGAAVGLILGHLRLPLLIAYLGSPAAGAMTNLIISGSGAVAGSASHVREGRVSWKGV